MQVETLNARVDKELATLVREAQKLVNKRSRGARSEARQVALESLRGLIEQATSAPSASSKRQLLPQLDSLISDLSDESSRPASVQFVEQLGFALVVALLLKAFVVEAFKIPSGSMYPTLEVGDHLLVNKGMFGFHVPFLDKPIARFRKPARGEVMVFKAPCEPWRDFIKRVVAVEGDTVEVRCDILYVNGQPVPRSAVGTPLTYSDYMDNAWVKRNVLRFRETNGAYSHDIYQDPKDSDAPGFEFPREVLSSCEVAKHVQAPGQVVVTDEHPPSVCARRAHFIVPPNHVFAMGDNRDNSQDSRAWGAVPMDYIKGKAMFIWLSVPEWKWELRVDKYIPQMKWERVGNFVH